ncbi:MAG: carboxypeptidase regulatory-like domain-containing protein [Bacteroidaceae bacterium]
MKKHKIRVLIAKGWCKVVCFVSFSLLSVVCNHASAQKAGDMISGVVSDKEGPMALVNVTQRDSLDRIVAQSITDREGKFTFPLLNPGNTIKVTYLGYEPVNLPINKQYYEIRLNELPGNEVHEVSAAFAAGESKGEFRPIIVDTTNLKNITTIDEALDGMIPGLDIVFNSGDLAYGPPVRSLMRRIDGAIVEKPLVVLDSKKKRIDDAKLESFVFENFFNRKSLAGLLGVEESSLKAVRYLQDPQSWTLYGRDGFWGVIEILTKEQYRKLKEEGKLEDDWQLLK